MADGNSIHTEQWIKGLSYNSILEIYLLTMSPSGTRAGIKNNPFINKIYELPIKKIRERGGNFAYLNNILAIRRIVKELKPDIISTIYLTSYGLIGSFVKDKALLSHFMIGSDIMVTPFRNVMYRLITQFALSRGDLFVSASYTLTNKLNQLFNVDEDRLLTQQYGVEDAILNYPEQKKKFDFISNRAWVPNSNIPFVLDIISNIGQHSTFAIIGSDGALAARILGRLNDLPSAVHLGKLPYMENIDAVAKSRFYISMTSSDGASLSLMEAMAVGSVPVVSNIEPNREWVEDGVNGYLVDIADLKIAIKKFNDILNTPESVLERMRDMNRNIILQRGSLTVNMRKFVNKLLQLAGEKEAI